MDTEEINKFLEDLHKMSEEGSMPDPVEDFEDYVEIVNQMKTYMFAMPEYKNKAGRAEIEEFTSLLGAFGKLFLRFEDAFLRLTEMGASGDLKPEEIIREHAFEVSIAIFQYVSKAMVHTQVETVTAGTLSGTFTTGAGTGAGSGKLS